MVSITAYTKDLLTVIPVFEIKNIQTIKKTVHIKKNKT
jgi:hypothetical protein